MNPFIFFRIKSFLKKNNYNRGNIFKWPNFVVLLLIHKKTICDRLTIRFYLLQISANVTKIYVYRLCSRWYCLIYFHDDKN